MDASQTLNLIFVKEEALAAASLRERNLSVRSVRERERSSAMKRFTTDVLSSEGIRRRKHIHLRLGWRVIRFIFSVLSAGLEVYSDRDGTSESECQIESIGEDGILCSILSHLTLRDAVRTSVLSRRWRNIWKHIPDLKFKADPMFKGDPAVIKYFLEFSWSDQQLFLGPRADMFVRSVDHVLRHRPAMGLNSFSLEHRLLMEHTPCINRWLSYAIDSGVKIIFLNLFERSFKPCSPKEKYAFPFQLFDSGRGSSLERLYVSYCTFRLPEQFTGFGSLKFLTLDLVVLCATDIKNILSICSNLQDLSIFRCNSLVTLNISHPAGRLESLSVDCCSKLEQIEFSGICLRMFYFRGERVAFTFKNAARIKELWATIYNNYFLTDLPRDFQHIEKLIVFAVGPIEVSRIPASYKFAHLKQLHLCLHILSKDGFIAMAFILNVVPLVETFHLDLRGVDTVYYPATRTWPNKYIHKHLKELKIGGFSSANEELDFVLYVVRSATVLETITLDPYYRLYTAITGWQAKVLRPSARHRWYERVFCPSALPFELRRKRARKFLNGNVGDIKLIIK